MAPVLLNGNATNSAKSNGANKCFDQEQIRLVNPLAELGPPFIFSLPSTTSGSDVNIHDPELTTIIEDKQKKSRNGKNSQGAGAKNSRFLTSINDWLPLQDIWLGPPNTYPISYWARLLGLVITNNDGVDLTEVKENSDDIGGDSVCLTKGQILTLSKLRDRRFDSTYHATQSGTFARHIWKGLRVDELPKTLRTRKTESELEDDRILGTYKDHLYQQLLLLNNVNNDLMNLVMGCGTSEEKTEANKYLLKSSRALTYRRSSSVAVEGATMVVVPVTPQEHAKFQVPVGRLVEIVDDVYSTASCSLASSKIEWIQNVYNEFNLKHDNHRSPLPKLWNPNKELKRYQRREAINKVENAPFYSFHTFSQARVRFPELSGELEHAITQNRGSEHQVVSPGVTDGWVAIVHNVSKEKANNNSSATAVQCQSSDDVEEQANANEEQNEIISDTKKTTNDWDECKEIVAKNECPNNSSNGNVAAIAGLLTYQFVWLREKTQNAEESDLVARILSIESIYDDTAAIKRTFGNLSNIDTNVENAKIRLLLISLSIALFKAIGVSYSFVRVRNDNERYFLENFFRMIGPSESRLEVMMICDLSMISHRYAIMYYNEKSDSKKATSVPLEPDQMNFFNPPKRRWLLSLPELEEDETRCHPSWMTESIGSPTQGTTSTTQHRFKATRANNSEGRIQVFSNIPAELRNNTVRLRVKLPQQNSNEEICPSHNEKQRSLFHVINNDIGHEALAMQLFRINLDGSDGDRIVPPSVDYDIPSLNLMRNFVLSQPEKSKHEDHTHDDISEEIVRLQDTLYALEQVLEPKLKSLLGNVIDDRIAYENEEADTLRYEEHHYLTENKTMLARRKELDQAWQKQLEQDMDAVCEICNDGEVTPDNQILFCEACNVAVHQMCYGIEHVPDGDYYCLPCKRLGRDKENATRGSVKSPPRPLPICCELCPLKQGAFVRTDVKRKDPSDAVDKWVHSVCAKWQGLSFVDFKKPDLLEDVTEIKYHFRRLGITCALCQGEYGAMTKCLHGENNKAIDSCAKWFHVTCARAVGTLRVIHGENCKGPIEENPWRLLCPEHSNLSADEIPPNSITVDTLVLAAKEFPPEALPPPEPIAPKPFNTATRIEREYLLSKPEYENPLMLELLTKKFNGARCEVCDHTEDDSKLLTRCSGCLLVFCNACKIKSDENNKSQVYYCPRCVYIAEKKKSGEGECTEPQCVVCVQRGGFLRKAVANPILRKSYWKNNKAVKTTLFGRQLWVHSMCAFWHPKLHLPYETGLVDLSNFVLSNGRGLVENRIPCYLCGNFAGMKIHCNKEGCRMNDGHPTSFHVTCARQAGFEVALREGKELEFFAHCYVHGSNAYNLRAKLEDMIEHETKRAANARVGKDFSKLDAPMTFSHGSKILHSGVQVMRILGWAWRWAELWVEHDSTWEPLLEPGQREELMTKEELRIVDSTRKSRCRDARRCRLAVFGCALRNRSYDTADGFNNDALHRALRAILSTQSLVGPLKGFEIDFFVEWLGRAYRSKSPLLFMGNDKIHVKRDSPFCVHERDNSPKFELGTRSIPGNQELSQGNLFESDVIETDSFLLSKSEKSKQSGQQTSKNKKESGLESPSDVLDNKSAHPSSQIQDVSTTSSTRLNRGQSYSDDAICIKPNETTGESSNHLMLTERKAKRKRIDNSSATSSHDVSPKQTKRQKDGPVKNKKAKSRLSPNKSPSAGCGNTPVSFFDISKWNASDEARKILNELANHFQYIQQMVSKAHKRGVLIEQFNLQSGDVIGLFTSVKNASANSGVVRNAITPILRNELPSDTQFGWRYVYNPAFDERLRTKHNVSVHSFDDKARPIKKNQGNDETGSIVAGYDTAQSTTEDVAEATKAEGVHFPDSNLVKLEIDTLHGERVLLPTLTGTNPSQTKHPNTKEEYIANESQRFLESDHIEKVARDVTSLADIAGMPQPQTLHPPAVKLELSSERETELMSNFDHVNRQQNTDIEHNVDDSRFTERLLSTPSSSPKCATSTSNADSETNQKPFSTELDGNIIQQKIDASTVQISKGEGEHLSGSQNIEHYVDGSQMQFANIEGEHLSGSSKNNEDIGDSRQSALLSKRQTPDLPNPSHGVAAKIYSVGVNPLCNDQEGTIEKVIEKFSPVEINEPTRGDDNEENIDAALVCVDDTIRRKRGRPKKKSGQVENQFRLRRRLTEDIVVDDLIPPIVENGSSIHQPGVLDHKLPFAVKRQRLSFSHIQKCGRKSFDLSRILRFTKGGRKMLSRWSNGKHFGQLVSLSSDRCTEIRSSGRHYFPLLDNVEDFDEPDSTSKVTRRKSSTTQSSRKKNASSSSSGKKKRGRPPKKKEDDYEPEKKSLKKRKLF